MFEKGLRDPWKSQYLIVLSYIYHAETIASLCLDFYSKELKLPRTVPLGIHLESFRLSLLLIIVIVLLWIYAFLFNFRIWHQTDVYHLNQLLGAPFSWINLAYRASLTSNSLLLRYHQSQVVCFCLHYYCLNYSSFQGQHHQKGFDPY